MWTCECWSTKVWILRLPRPDSWSVGHEQRRQQRSGDNHLGQRTDLWRGMTAGRYTAAGTGFTSRIITSPDGDIAEDKVVSSAGSNTAAAPMSTSTKWVMQIATFRASP